MEALGYLRGIERNLLPRLQPRLDADRIRHIRAVNNAFDALIGANYGRIFDALPPQIKGETNYDRYCGSLAKVREQSLSLPQREKNNLAAAVALHDIGYLEDPGLLHNERGAALVSHFMMVCGIRGIDRMAVSEMVKAHGLYTDSTVQFLISDTKKYSEQRKTQIFILNILDCIGKPAGSNLSQMVLETLIDLKEGVYDDPQKYFELRLRTLLGPVNYSWADADTCEVLTKSIELLSKDERESVYRNVTSRFRNHCWPVFQELVMKWEGGTKFFGLLLVLSKLADREFPDKKDIDIVFEPDFFSLTAIERAPYLAALRYRLLKNDALRTLDKGASGVIILDMTKLLAAS